MKKINAPTRLIVLCAIITLAGTAGCAKNEQENICRTCTARYNGEVIATIDACTAEEEENFKDSHYYATTSCR